MTLKSLRVALGLPLFLGACVDTQNLGDPQGTDGETGETGETDDTEIPTSAGPPSGTTDGEAETDGSIHDDCVELVWSCPSDDLVCLPEGLCVPCAGEGESPASAAGGHCCSGLVQNEAGTQCVIDPGPNGCLAPGDICGYSGVTQDCCEGSVCNPLTDICESDGSEPAGACADFEPPAIDNCLAGGEASAGLDIVGGLSGENSTTCTVAMLSSDGVGESISLDCGAEAYVVTYTSASPHLPPPLAEDDEVLFSLGFEELPEARPSMTIRTPQGELLVAFVEHRFFAEPLAVPLDELAISYGETGCSPFDAGSPLCNVEGELIVSTHVSVELQSDTGVAGGQAGRATDFTIGERTYDVIVDEADRIACIDPSCAIDDGGPFDMLQMLIVAR